MRRRSTTGNREPDRRDSQLSAKEQRRGETVESSLPPASQQSGDYYGTFEPDRVDRVLSDWQAAIASLSTSDAGPPSRNAARPAAPAGTVTMAEIAWFHQVNKRMDLIPPAYCQTCWVRWNKQLWPSSCVCTGAVSLQFSSPRF